MAHLISQDIFLSSRVYERSQDPLLRGLGLLDSPEDYLEGLEFEPGPQLVEGHCLVILFHIGMVPERDRVVVRLESYHPL